MEEWVVDVRVVYWRLSVEYGKKRRLSMLHYTDGDPLSTAFEIPVTYPYNQVLSIFSLLEHADQAFLFDNNRFEGN
jgi:hypothetical protein